MQKKVGIALVLVFVGGSLYGKFFSIDSGRVFQESREGRQITIKMDKKRKAVMNIEFEESKKIAQARTEIEEAMKSGKVSEEELQGKYEKLARLQRDAKHKVECARADFKIEDDKIKMKFAQKIQLIASNFFKAKGSDVTVVDRKSPGLIFMSKSLDKTDELIKEIDRQHGKKLAKSLITKEKAKA
jgi:Skp family chaperone for outer membrane proteins